MDDMTEHKEKQTANRWIFWLLQMAAAAVLLGRAYQQLVWDIPIRELLWDQSVFGPVVRLFGGNWDAWASSQTVGRWINRAVQLGGLLYATGLLAVVRINPRRKWTHWYLWACSFCLAFLAFLYMKEKFSHLGQFLEYSLQFGAPLFLVWYVRSEQAHLVPRLDWAIRIAIACTFTAHGLYAFGYYPRPGNFLDMTMAGFGVGEATANTLLWWAGILDFVASALLLLPQRQLQFVGLAYAVFWGFLTTAARIEAYYFLTDFPTLLTQWVYQSVYRFPHFILPLVALVNLTIQKFPTAGGQSI